MNTIKYKAHISVRRFFKSRGDTLIEVLITFFVISVGILSASRMQIMTLQNINEADNRDQATMIAENIAEEIRTINETLASLSDDTAKNTALNNGITALTTKYVTSLSSLPSSTVKITAPTLTSTPSDKNVEFTVTVRWDTSDNSEQIACEDTCYQSKFTIVKP